MKRKCSFRFLVVDGDRGYVVTQDVRRKNRVVTGSFSVWCGDYALAVAKDCGCSVIIRKKAL